MGTTPQGRLGFRISGSAGFLEASSSLLNFLDGEFWSVMLSRESASDSNDIDQTFKLTTKQYNAGKSDILYVNVVARVRGVRSRISEGPRGNRRAEKR